MDRYPPDQPGPDPATPLDYQFATFADAQRIAGGVCDATLRRWWRKSLFPKPRQVGPGRIGWLWSELRDWAESRPQVP